jgi:hypothetical protein
MPASPPGPYGATGASGFDGIPCPACGQYAPIVYRGVVPHCTACDAVRVPLSATSVNLAGKPTRVGSTFATVLGWLVLVFGGCTALGVGLLMMALGWSMGALVFGLPIAIATLLVGLLLVRSGSSLAKSATRSENDTLRQALLAMASHKGAVTAREAAQALGVAEAEADAMLTALAKSDPDRVGVDVDDQGNVWYRVAAAPGEPLPHVRVGDGPRVAEPAPAELLEAEEEARKKAGR